MGTLTLACAHVLGAENPSYHSSAASGPLPFRSRVIAEFAACDAQHAAELKAEQAQTEKAIAAFAALAERLDALAAERAKPSWWRRMAG